MNLEEARRWMLDADSRIECVGCKQAVESFDYALAVFENVLLAQLAWPRYVLRLKDAIAWCHSDERVEYSGVRAACTAYVEALEKLRDSARAGSVTA